MDKTFGGIQAHACPTRDTLYHHSAGGQHMRRKTTV